MPYRRQYGIGTGADLYRSLTKFGATSFAVAADWTPAAGDVKVSKDGAAAANIGTLPVYVTSCGWKFVFADAELQCKLLKVLVTKGASIEDDGFEIETENSHLAAFPNGVVRQSTLQAVAAGTATLDAAASATDSVYNGMQIVVINATTGIGQSARIKSYVGATKVATLYENWPLTPTGTVLVNIYSDGGIGVALTGDAFLRLGAPAGASVSADIATATGYVNPNVAAIKAKTDALPGTPAATGDPMALTAAYDAAKTYSGYRKNILLNGFTFTMYDNVNHVPAAGKVVAATRSINGGAYAPCAGTVVEIGSTGRYQINLQASDMNGDVIALRFTATGCDDVDITIKTQA